MRSLRPASLLLLPALTAALSLSGCKPDPALRKAENVQRTSALPTADTRPSPDAGEITGTVSFHGTAPQRIAIDMSMDPACSLAPGTNLTEQYVVTHGHLANVFVTIRPGGNVSPSTAPVGQPAVRLDQHGCRYVPHVIAVQQGGTVEFDNSDPTTHNIHSMPITAGDQTIDLSEQPGAQVTHTFTHPEIMMPIRCNNHPWMNAFLNVAQTPYFAVTGTDGSFTLHNLPPGTYTVMAIHEKLGEQDTTVTVPSSGTAKADFTFTAK